MSGKAWDEAQRNFRRQFIGSARLNASVAARDRENDMMIAFREGYMRGYDDSNTMWQKKTKERA